MDTNESIRLLKIENKLKEAIGLYYIILGMYLVLKDSKDVN